MKRINKDDLLILCDRINEMTNSPKKTWVKVNGKLVSSPNNYHLDWAYGGVSLVRNVNDGGGIQNIIPGFRSKRELYELMQAYIKGIGERS